MNLLRLIVLGAATEAALAQDCSWIQRLPADNPTRAFWAPMCFDVAHSVMLLCNWKDGPKTWAWDGEDWQVRAGTDPSYGAMAYDSKRQVAVLFNEEGTWEWDGQVWTKRHPPQQPHGRVYAGIAFDSVRGVIVLFGGEWEDENDIHYLGDTWEYDGTTWTQVADSGPGSGGAWMAFDPERGVSVVQGKSGIWEWDGQAWTHIPAEEPPGLGGGPIVYDADLYACVLFSGGYLGDGTGDQDTWTWDGKGWTTLEVDAPPPGRRYHAMSYDSARHAVILYGGQDEFGVYLTDTWEFSRSPPPCYPDLDANGTLDLFDFLAFANLFNNSDPTADCDSDGAFSLFDFLCFTNAFNAGC